MRRFVHDSWLHRFAVATAAATLALIGIGGLVTSHEAGLAVPDWPTTYGYNMFLFPPSNWVGGIFYEHTHRLFASFVGLLTTILAIWLWIKEPRRWVRWLGVAAFFAVVGQGVLGGLRVTMLRNQIGIFHATLAHLFFVLVCLIAIVTSEWWNRVHESRGELPISLGLRFFLLGAVAMVLTQLVLGASMRHQHAGLAVPDFPLAYGKLWPPTNSAALEAINRNRTDGFDPNPITAFQIFLHMAHRIGAVVTLVMAGLIAWQIKARCGSRSVLSKLCWSWFVMVIVQATFGAATVWSKKAADVATLHVVLGAASLAFGTMVFLIASRLSEGTRTFESTGMQRVAHAVTASQSKSALTIG